MKSLEREYTSRTIKFSAKLKKEQATDQKKLVQKEKDLEKGMKICCLYDDTWGKSPVKSARFLRGL